MSSIQEQRADKSDFHNSVCHTKTARDKRCLCAVLVMRELTFKVYTGKFRAMLSMIVQIESNEVCFNCRGEAYLMKLSIKHSRTQNCIIIYMFYTAIRIPAQSEDFLIAVFVLITFVFNHDSLILFSCAKCKYEFER